MERKERDLLTERFRSMKANDGLVDLKFFFGQVSESTVADVCEEVNRLYRLVDEGKYTKLERWGDAKKLPNSA